MSLESFEGPPIFGASFGLWRACVGESESRLCIRISASVVRFHIRSTKPFPRRGRDGSLKRRELVRLLFPRESPGSSRNIRLPRVSLHVFDSSQRQ